MGLSVYQGTFAVSTGAINTTQDITAPGFQPAFVIFWWNERTSGTNASGAASWHAGVGFAVSTTDRRCANSYSQDAQARGNSSRGQHVAACVGLQNAAGSGWDSLLDYNGVITGGFQVIVDAVFASAIQIHYLAVGGTDITNVSTGSFQSTTSTGNLGVTAPGFQPTGGLFISAGVNSGSSFTTTGACLSLGAAKSSSEQGFATINAIDNPVTMDTHGLSNDVSLIESTVGSTSPQNRITFVSFDTNGFTINKDEVTQPCYYHYIVWKGGQFSVKSGSTRTDGNNISVSYGFVPAAGLVWSAPWGTGGEDTTDTLHQGLGWSMGGYTSTSARSAVSVRDQDAAADSNTASAIYYDAVYIHLNESADSVDALMDISSVASPTIFVMDDTDPATQFFMSCAWAANAPTGVTVEPAAADNFSLTGTSPTIVLGAVSVAPSAATDLSLTASNPTTVLGAITISPSAADNLSLTGSSPAVIHGAISIIPFSAQFAVDGSNPAVVQGAITVSPAAGDFSLTANNPIVALNPLIVEPVAGEFSTTANNPTVILGAISITASSAQFAVNGSNPVVVLGAVSITASPAQFAVDATDPTVIVPLVIQPSAAQYAVNANSPTVILGAITVSPAACDFSITASDPFIPAGSGVIVTPVAAEFSTTADNPTVVLGSLSIQPNSAQFATTATNPAIVLGALSIQPNSAQYAVTASSPAVVFGGITIQPNPAQYAVTGSNPVVVQGAISITAQSAQFGVGGSNPVVVQGAVVYQPVFAQFAVIAQNPAVGEPVKPVAGEFSIVAFSPIVWVTPIPANLVVSVANMGSANLAVELDSNISVSSDETGNVEISVR